MVDPTARLSIRDLGSLNLYLRDPARLTQISIADAVAVTDHVFHALTADPDPPVPKSTSSGAEPRWANGPAPVARRTVWIGMGMMTSVLGVGSADALTLLRAYAYSHDRTVDDLAQLLVDGDLAAETLRP